MPQACVALGGNLGDVAATFARAQSLLAKCPGIEVTGNSRIYRTAPVGTDAGPPYRNAALTLQTTLPPLELLDQLQSIETTCGRIRTTHWGPRPLDLDLLLYDDLELAHPRLQIPHPACWYRRFVLDPLAEIAGSVMHPTRQQTIAELRGRLLPRPLNIALCGPPVARLESRIAGLAPRFPQARIIAATPQDLADTDTQDTGPSAISPALILYIGSDDTAADNFAEFATLPHLPRLDLTDHADPATAVTDVLTAALDAPVPE